MKSKKYNIAIFENEFHLVQDDFRITNYAFFDELLEYEVFESSQKFGNNYDKIHQYDLCFIDIDLSKSSEYDGLKVISRILQAGYDENRIIVLTGHSTIEEKIKDRNLPNLSILRKPIDIDDLRGILESSISVI